MEISILDLENEVSKFEENRVIKICPLSKNEFESKEELMDYLENKLSKRGYYNILMENDRLNNSIGENLEGKYMILRYGKELVAAFEASSNLRLRSELEEKDLLTTEDENYVNKAGARVGARIDIKPESFKIFSEAISIEKVLKVKNYSRDNSRSYLRLSKQEFRQVLQSIINHRVF